MLLECLTCEAVVAAVHVASYKIEDDASDISEIQSFSKCPQCEQPFIATQYQFPDGELDDPVQAFPRRNVAHVGAAVPRAIRGAYEEALSCMKAKAYTAAAIMCRKTLEGICDAHYIQERNLKRSLEMMRDQGVIEARLFQWADALRIFGNEAAHGVGVTISPQDATDIMHFTNALLEYVFTFRDRFDEFMARRGKTPLPPPATP
jgi:hypothetical protein